MDEIKAINILKRYSDKETERVIKSLAFLPLIELFTIKVLTVNEIY